MDKQAFLQLVNKFLKGETTPEEELVLRRFYESFQNEPFNGSTWQDSNDLTEKRILKKLEDTLLHKRNTKIGMIRIAAAILLALVVVSLYMYFKAGSKTRPQKVWCQTRTGTGEKKIIKLPDGTTVWLNAASIFSYPSTFPEGKREVSLDGEAYLIVATNARAPFVVHTSHMDIRVLGTEFNIKSYHTDKSAETSLISGSVEINVVGKHKKFVLKPHQKLFLDQRTPPEIKHTSNLSRTTDENLKKEAEVLTIVNDAAEAGWKDDRMIFTDEKFENIARELERWYGVSILFKRTSIANSRFTATLSHKDGIDQVLEALQYTSSFNYRKEGPDKIIIY